MNQNSLLFFNRCFDKNKLKGLISWSLRNYGEAVTLELVEKLKTVGFSWATNAGISLSIDDLKIPKEKSSLLFSAEQVSENTGKQFLSGNLTAVERLQQLIDAWHRTSELLKQEVVQNFRRSDPLNPVYMMAFSGARGNISQVRQLVGMRGLMADPQGRIIDFPIRSNFREGLTLTEYVISCYGARKGIVDTALRTATSGYLTRRLVDVSHHVVVSSYDCETNEGIFLSPLKEFSKTILGLNERLIGRVLAEDLPGIGEKNTSVSQYIAHQIHQKYEKVFVRSPLSCKARTGVCQLCYGWSLAHGELVSIGEAVGVIAAQSIGEPGTQLTMRTFHTGGVFSGEIIQQIESSMAGIVKFSDQYKGTLVRTSYGKIGFLTRQAGFFYITENETIKTKIDFPPQTILFVREGQKVEAHQMVGEYPSTSPDQDQGIQSTHLVTAPKQGEIFFEDVVILPDEKEDEEEKKTYRLGVSKAYRLGSFWVLSSELEPNSFNSLATFAFSKGDFIPKNSSYLTIGVVNPTPFESFLSQDSSLFFDKKLPTLNTKYLTFCNDKFFYSKGIYLTKSHYSTLNRGSFNSNFLFLFRTFEGLSLSFVNFFFSDTERKENFDFSKSTLFLSFLKNPFLFSKIFFFLSIFKKPYKFKSFEVFKKFSGNKSSLFLKQKETKTILKKGSYCFKSFKLKKEVFSSPQKKLKLFYTNLVKLEPEKFQKINGAWTGKVLNFSYFTFLTLKEKIEVKGFFNRFLFSLNLEKPLIIQERKFSFQKSYFYKNFYKFSKNQFFSLFFKKSNFLETNFHSFFEKTSRNRFASFCLFTKVSYFPFFTNAFCFNPYLKNEKIFNKQKVDKTLFKKNEINFDWKEISLEKKVIGFLTFKANNDLIWTVNLPASLEPIALMGVEKILLPKVSNLQNKSAYKWSKLSNQFNEENFVLGKINKTFIENTEILKAFNPNGMDQFLFVTKNDLTGIALNTQKEKLKVFLGALIRPNDSIGNHSTISFSGQVLSIQKNKVLIRKALPILFSANANFHVFHGYFVEKGLPLITLSYKRLMTGDIVQGIPRIEQLFEARQSTSLLHDQLHELFETYRTQMKLDKAARKSLQKIQRILIDSIQKSYQTQGVTISDKHIEIIVRQMTSTIRILDGGRTRLLRGELKPIDWIEKINSGIDVQKAEYEPVLLGISKASLETDSFISAASFQETAKILGRATIEGRTDYLRGLKENVILGHRIPAGTGAPLISYLTKFASEMEHPNSDSSLAEF